MATEYVSGIQTKRKVCGWKLSRLLKNSFVVVL